MHPRRGSESPFNHREVQQEFLAIVEDSISQPDISKSFQRFQLVLEEAKVRLDLALSPETWLMPLNMVLNTERTVVYNNNLNRATH